MRGVLVGQRSRELGYRHIDTAQGYRNEDSVGRSLRDSGTSRDELYITTKFLPAQPDPFAAVEQRLDRLRVNYVDLYLVQYAAWLTQRRLRSRLARRAFATELYEVNSARWITGETPDHKATLIEPGIPAALGSVATSPSSRPRACRSIE